MYFQFSSIYFHEIVQWHDYLCPEETWQIKELLQSFLFSFSFSTFKLIIWYIPLKIIISDCALAQHVYNFRKYWTFFLIQMQQRLNDFSIYLCLCVWLSENEVLSKVQSCRYLLYKKSKSEYMNNPPF